MLSAQQSNFLAGMAKAIDETFNPPPSDPRIITPDTWGFALFMWKIGEDFSEGTYAGNRDQEEMIEIVRAWLAKQDAAMAENAERVN
jgi:hypothetical protein